MPYRHNFERVAMLKQKVNINSFQKNFPDFIDLVMKGDEIIITKANVPIAKVTPIEKKNVKISDTFISAKVLESKRVISSEAPENWFG
jgi:prevent-host-death family protein